MPKYETDCPKCGAVLKIEHFEQYDSAQFVTCAKCGADIIIPSYGNEPWVKSTRKPLPIEEEEEPESEAEEEDSEVEE